MEQTELSGKYSLTYSRSWALFEEPLIVQALKNFPAFYGTEKFNTVFTKPCSDPYPEPYQSNQHHPILFLWDPF
jgi:hypothetical protein